MSEASDKEFEQRESEDSQRRIVLASGSPRRLKLMRNLGFLPEVHVSAILEQRAAGEVPRDYTRRLALAKAQGVRVKLSEDLAAADWILAADTVVIIEDNMGDEVVLEKPADAQAAASMLRRLSGRTHEVETSFCWLQRSTGRSSVRSVRARVEFRELSDATIQRYVATGEPSDKAGGYGIQGVASALVRRIDGSYFTVVGLPVCEVVEELEQLGGLDGFPFSAN